MVRVCRNAFLGPRAVDYIVNKMQPTVDVIGVRWMCQVFNRAPAYQLVAFLDKYAKCLPQETTGADAWAREQVARLVVGRRPYECNHDERRLIMCAVEIYRDHAQLLAMFIAHCRRYSDDDDVYTDMVCTVAAAVHPAVLVDMMVRFCEKGMAVAITDPGSNHDSTAFLRSEACANLIVSLFRILAAHEQNDRDRVPRGWRQRVTGAAIRHFVDHYRSGKYFARDRAPMLIAVLCHLRPSLGMLRLDPVDDDADNADADAVDAILTVLRESKPPRNMFSRKIDVSVAEELLLACESDLPRHRAVLAKHAEWLVDNFTGLHKWRALALLANSGAIAPYRTFTALLYYLHEMQNECMVPSPSIVDALAAHGLPDGIRDVDLDYCIRELVRMDCWQGILPFFRSTTHEQQLRACRVVGICPNVAAMAAEEGISTSQLIIMHIGGALTTGMYRYIVWGTFELPLLLIKLRCAKKFERLDGKVGAPISVSFNGNGKLKAPRLHRRPAEITDGVEVGKVLEKVCTELKGDPFIDLIEMLGGVRPHLSVQ